MYRRRYNHQIPLGANLFSTIYSAHSFLMCLTHQESQLHRLCPTHLLIILNCDKYKFGLFFDTRLVVFVFVLSCFLSLMSCILVF